MRGKGGEEEEEEEEDDEKEGGEVVEGGVKERVFDKALCCPASRKKAAFFPGGRA